MPLGVLLLLLAVHDKFHAADLPVVVLVQVWSVCPINSSSSLREENAIVCCSMLGGLTASKCLCDEVGHAEPDMLHFITNWQRVCSTESLSKVVHFTESGSGIHLVGSHDSAQHVTGQTQVITWSSHGDTSPATQHPIQA